MHPIPVVILNADKKKIGEYVSVKKAGESLGCDHEPLYMALKGTYPYHHKYYVVKKEDYDNGNYVLREKLRGSSKIVLLDFKGDLKYEFSCPNDAGIYFKISRAKDFASYLRLGWFFRRKYVCLYKKDYDSGNYDMSIAEKILKRNKEKKERKKQMEKKRNDHRVVIFSRDGKVLEIHSGKLCDLAENEGLHFEAMKTRVHDFPRRKKFLHDRNYGYIKDFVKSFLMAKNIGYFIKNQH